MRLDPFLDLKLHLDVGSVAGIGTYFGSVVAVDIDCYKAADFGYDNMVVDFGFDKAVDIDILLLSFIRLKFI